MTASVSVGSRRISTKTVLFALLGLAIATALLTPEAATGGSLSSYSTSSGGAQIMYELAQRMGWQARRRETPMPDKAPLSVQVVIGPEDVLGAHEIHRLLENVRRGGGLIVSADGRDGMTDSIGLLIRRRAAYMMAPPNDCARSRAFDESSVGALPPNAHEIAWRRPPPGIVTTLATGFSGRRYGPSVAIGVLMGKGRIAVIGSEEMFTNEAMRTCRWGSDVPVARAIEFVQPADGMKQPIVFDEFHHGYGVHGGSMTAVWTFLSHTASGRFLAQALVAAMILLFAAAPRPIVPRDPERIARRSPLEHADALGHAYVDVKATRTATARLVGGLRRRAGRTVPVDRNADDLTFLDAVARRSPGLADRVSLVRRALTHALSVRDFIPVGEAIAGIERELLTSPPAKT